MASVSISLSDGGMVYVNHSEGHVILVAISPRKGDVASVPIRPSEGGVPIRARERGVASVRSVQVKEVWPLYPLVTVKVI